LGKDKHFMENDPAKEMNNYAYWREHGGEWWDEYEQRKKRQLYYHIQEIMLADYFEHYAPARILEFGCGVGRHLSYLRNIPGIEAHGYDQSPAMVMNCLHWTSQEWIDQFIKIGEPVSTLPYPDQYFDIAFTSEVLIHIRPADIEAVLRELIRISKQQVLHLEPNVFFQVTVQEHSGCWLHDLPTLYTRMGYRCDYLVPGYEVQSPYRVVLSAEKPAYTWSPVKMGLYRRLDMDIQPGLNNLAIFEALAKSQQIQLEATQSKLDETGNELAAIKFSRSYRFAQRLKRTRLAGWMAKLLS
jgi:SAM-dependent methyltransferase